ncbi:MAG: hypothetical protein SAJ37_13205 [Oscillatoria sp. PMC 1068.18]|nr:hypothetical protein [Oscillatoria sp. PMC 1076.18]MEC4989681.1 hypothetical protein [Oscillatoria sp. PMC 1068.18]
MKNPFKLQTIFSSLLLGVSFASLSVAVSPTSVAAFSYNETVDGDLPSFARNSPIFALDIGENTFIGEQTFGYNFSDFDSFTFKIPDGTFLESILIDIELLTVGAGILSRTTYSLLDESLVNLDLEESIVIASSDRQLFLSSLPLSSGQYSLQHNSLSGAVASGEFRTASYTFSLNVGETAPKSVPEPNNLLSLLAFGALITGNTFRKKLLGKN